MKNLKKILMSFVLALALCVPTFALVACKNNDTSAEPQAYTRQQASEFVNSVYNSISGENATTGVSTDKVLLTTQDVYAIKSTLLDVKEILAAETWADKYYKSEGTVRLNGDGTLDYTVNAKYELLTNGVKYFCASKTNTSNYESKALKSNTSVILTKNGENDWHLIVLSWNEKITAEDVGEEFTIPATVNYLQVDANNDNIYFYRIAVIAVKEDAELTKENILEEDLTLDQVNQFHYAYADVRNGSSNTKDQTNISATTFSQIYKIVKNNAEKMYVVSFENVTLEDSTFYNAVVVARLQLNSVDTEETEENTEL